MARRRRRAEPSEGADWMYTYGDMITLLLVFFVLLLSFSTLDAQKWEALVETFARESAAQALEHGASAAPADLSDILQPEPMTRQQALLEERERASKQGFSQAVERVEDMIGDMGLEDSLLLEVDGDSMTFRFVDSLLFDSGEADLKPDSMAMVLEILSILEEAEGYIATIQIEGHTDDVPIQTNRFRDNWDLSVMRASTVLREFAGRTSIPAQKLKASGRGESMPIAANDTPQGRAMNRRVDIVIERLRIQSDYVAYPDIDEGMVEALPPQERGADARPGGEM